VIAFTALPELSLYIHLPWCIQKCPYCDFNSHQAPDALPQARYVDALIADLDRSLPDVWGRPISSIFIGGGTPSLFEPAEIDRLLAAVRARLRLLPGAEITMEANPGTFEAERFQGFAQAGINRLSIGVQSFDDAQLKVLGRVHDRGQAVAAVETALTLFPRVNLDLMFGLPNQTMAQLDQELRQAIALGVSHLSCYQLTLEPNTRFAVSPPSGLPDDDLLADMQAHVVDRLASHGLHRYEISAYARSHSDRSAHNLNYWTFGDYLGIGAGAHGKISSASRICRTSKFRHPMTYIDRALETGDGATEVLDDVGIDALPFEFMLNALRLMDGVPTGRWQLTTGLSIGAHPFLLDRLGQAQARGLMVSDLGVFRCTPRGFELLNEVQALFLK
jgi:oxygen-independent coproporphyrinogen-3 oxidase